MYNVCTVICIAILCLWIFTVLYFNDYIQTDSDVVVGATDVMSSFVEDRYEFKTIIIVKGIYNYVIGCMEVKFHK